MAEGAMNLSLPRSEKSVWEQPRRLSDYDNERWAAAAIGAALSMIGTRRGGAAGAALALAGGVLAARAAMGRHDLRLAQTWVGRTMNRRGRREDIVQHASEESFPASDPPAWTVAE